MSASSMTADPALPPARPILRIDFLAAWSLLSIGAGFFLWALSRVWFSTPDMNDRFLIPAASAWLLWRNLARWRQTPSVPNSSGLVLVLVGALLAPPAWLLLVQVGAQAVLLWWLFAAIAVAAFGLLVVQHGWRKSWQTAFPILFCAMALPAPGRLMGAVQLPLTEATTAATANVLPWLGIPTERRGNTLDLPSGRMGVVDACSGVRSVTALTAIALFVAYLRGFSAFRSLALVTVTMAIVIVSNSARVIVTGILQELIGPQVTQGFAHEALGYLVILVGLTLIVSVAKLMTPNPIPDAAPSSNPDPVRHASGGFAAAVLLAASLAGCAWAEQARTSLPQSARLDQLPMTILGWTGKDEPIPEVVEYLLKCDQIVHRLYAGSLGEELELYSMVWTSPANPAHRHHPDICMPCQGWTLESSHLRLVSYAPDRRPIPISVRTYTQDHRRQLIMFWTQVGRDVLPDGVETPSAFDEFAWMWKILSRKTTLSRTARLTVQLSIESPGAPGRLENVLADLAAEVARKTYAICPWAEPEH